MYTISNNYDLKRLHGASVQQICFSANTATLLLEGIGFVTIEGRFSVTNEVGIKKEFEVYPVSSDFGLLKLLEQKIQKAYTNDKRSDLILEFDSNYTVVLLGDDNYESYVIKIGDDETRV